MFNNFYLRFIKDIERGINFYHENNNTIINSISKKINKLYSQTSFFSNRDYIYLLLDKLKKYLLEQNYIDNFKSVDNQLIYVNDYIEFKLGLKMVQARVIYDHFGYYICEIRGGYMRFTQQDYTIIGNQNTNPVN
mgnify:CR=1 FL=1